MLFLLASLLSVAPTVSPALRPLSSGAPTTAATHMPTVSERVRRLHKLLGEQWEYALRTSPEFASVLGDKRYNDRWADVSQAAVERNLRQTRVFLDQFSAIDTTGFPVQEKLNHARMVRNLQETLDAARFTEGEMPVNQFNGLHIDLPQLVTALSFATVKDYEDYATRLRRMPRLFAQTEAQMRRGMADRLMPPRMLLEQVATQAATLSKQAADESPFALPHEAVPETLLRGRAATPQERDSRSDPRQCPADLRPVHRLRPRRIRAERQDRHRHLGAASWPGALRLRRAPDDDDVDDA
jgi:uncharacterized protein (DUF885 family)